MAASGTAILQKKIETIGVKKFLLANKCSYDITISVKKAHGGLKSYRFVLVFEVLVSDGA